MGRGKNVDTEYLLRVIGWKNRFFKRQTLMRIKGGSRNEEKKDFDACNSNETRWREITRQGIS